MRGRVLKRSAIRQCGGEEDEFKMLVRWMMAGPHVAASAANGHVGGRQTQAEGTKAKFVLSLCVDFAGHPLPH
jgi:hypothetical protein